MFITV